MRGRQSSILRSVGCALLGGNCPIRRENESSAWLLVEEELKEKETRSNLGLTNIYSGGYKWKNRHHRLWSRRQGTDAAGTQTRKTSLSWSLKPESPRGKSEATKELSQLNTVVAPSHARKGVGSEVVNRIFMHILRINKRYGK